MGWVMGYQAVQCNYLQTTVIIKRFTKKNGLEIHWPNFLGNNKSCRGEEIGLDVTSRKTYAYFNIA